MSVRGMGVEEKSRRTRRAFFEASLLMITMLSFPVAVHLFGSEDFGDAVGFGMLGILIAWTLRCFV